MFEVDSRILSTCILIHEDQLSNVYLKNAKEYPWLILVPRVLSVRDIDELTHSQQSRLMQEISDWSVILKQNFQPQKLNIGALGNIVSQLHIHIVARFEHDLLWPHGIWQSSLETTPYSHEALQSILESFSSHQNQR